MTSATDLENWRKLAIHLAEESGEIVRRYHRSGDLGVELKSDATPVTVADRATEECLRAILEREVPDHGILGEEFGATRPDSRYQWILDPIDGTKSFVYGGMDFGTLIALLDRGDPILGVVHQPVLRELVIGDGQTTTLNGQPIRVRDCATIEDAVLLCTDFAHEFERHDAAAFVQLAHRVKLSRTWGNCYGYTLVAAGFADIMIDPIVAKWDIMPLIPVMRGAGALITDYHGDDPRHGDSLVAATPEVHAAVLAALNPDSRGN